MHDVFISYSHKDKVIADAVCARFESENIRCWYAPRDIVPGADWAGSIIDAIKEAKIMVMIFTDFSNASTQVLREVNNAVSAGIPIVPFKLTESLPTKGMQYYLSTVHWLDAMNHPLENSIEQLFKLVQAMLNGTAPTPVLTPPVLAQPKRRKWLLPVIIAALVVLIGAGAAVFFLTQRGAAPADVTETSQSGATKRIVTEVRGMPKIENPLNSGAEGNLQGNYQQGGLACSDGKMIYYINNSDQLCKMNIDGSDVSVIAEDFKGYYLGVIDDVLYYYCSKNGQQGVHTLELSTGKDTSIYTGILEGMIIAEGRIYFSNSEDRLKLYSMKTDGTDLHKENDLQETYSLTIWKDRLYFSYAPYNGCLYSSKLDGSDLVMLTETYVDSVTAADGWLEYNADDHLHLLDIETNEDYAMFNDGLYSPVITTEGIVGESSFNNLYLYLLPHGAMGGDIIQSKKPEAYSVVEGKIFFIDSSDSKLYMMNIDGSDLHLL